MNDLAVVNRSRGLPRPVEHQIVNRNPAPGMVLGKLLDEIDRLNQRLDALEVSQLQPYFGAGTRSRWIDSHPIEMPQRSIQLAQPLPPVEPAPQPPAPRRFKVRRSGLLDIFD